KLAGDPDVVYFLAECQVEKCKTWAKMARPDALPSAEQNMDRAIINLGQLAKGYKKIPMYQESLGAAYGERGRLRLQGRNYNGAGDDFNKSIEVVAVLVQNYGHLPGPRGELGRAYAGLGRIAVQLKDEDPSAWIKKAGTELRVAVARSPEDAHLQRSLDDLA